MKVLVGCEFSGIVREAFRELGHEAWSCDIIPAEDKSPFHFQMDLNLLLDDPKLQWDLLIAHPPCTYISNSGVRWLFTSNSREDVNDRWHKMREAADFFKKCYTAPIPRICIENPIMHKYAKQHADIPKQTQLIQPWLFGHKESKSTCLWLKGLPLLRFTDIVKGWREHKIHREKPGIERWKLRSRTLTGVAKAMAGQWGGKIIAP